MGFPSGQREQTVNLPSSTSKVRILPPPPSPHVMPSLINLRYFIFYPTGKDEKLRLRFDSSASERTLPRATARRARSDSDELSFPHHHPLKNTAIQLLYDILDSALPGRMRSFDQGSTRAPARERCRRQRPEGRGTIATSYPSPSILALSATTCTATCSLALRLARLHTVLLSPRSRFA